MIRFMTVIALIISAFSMNGAERGELALNIYRSINKFVLIATNNTGEDIIIDKELLYGFNLVLLNTKNEYVEPRNINNIIQGRERPVITNGSVERFCVLKNGESRWREIELDNKIRAFVIPRVINAGTHTHQYLKPSEYLYEYALADVDVVQWEYGMSKEFISNSEKFFIDSKGTNVEIVRELLQKVYRKRQCATIKNGVIVETISDTHKSPTIPPLPPDPSSQSTPAPAAPTPSPKAP